MLIAGIDNEKAKKIADCIKEAMGEDILNIFGGEAYGELWPEHGGTNARYSKIYNELDRGLTKEQHDLLFEIDSIDGQRLSEARREGFEIGVVLGGMIQNPPIGQTGARPGAKRKGAERAEAASSPSDLVIDALDARFFWLMQPWAVVADRSVLVTPEGPRLDAIVDQHKGQAQKKIDGLLDEIAANLPEGRRGLARELETQISEAEANAEEFPMLLGFCFGLRLAGLSSEEAKRLARAWKFGWPCLSKETA